MAKAKHDHYVYSNMAAGVTYATSREVPGRDLPETIPGIHIAGGVGVADKKSLITPQGAVITGISSEDLARLREDRVFCEHEKNGALRVSDHNEDAEVVASDLRARDESSPLTPQDYEAEGKDAPVVGADVSAKDDEPKRNPRKA